MMRKSLNNKQVITKKQFDDLNKNAKLSGEPAVLALLKRNPKSAFKAKTLAKVTSTNKWTIFAILKRLVKKKIVVHNKPYYAIASKSIK